MHGRTREQGYKGVAEYDTIAAVKAALAIPVVANGDIDSPEKARAVLAYTRADALMIGRARRRGGRGSFARSRTSWPPASTSRHRPRADAAGWLIEHLHDHYGLYGELTGVRSARKHIGWAVRELPGGEAFRAEMNRIDDCRAQVAAVSDWFAQLAERHERLPRITAPAANDDLIELSA